jgi:hypothetical protein
MPFQSKLPTAVAVVAMFLLTASGTAQAAQRYAAPDGSGTECTQAAPCTLDTAVHGVAGHFPQNGDEVLVAAGDYGSPAAPLTVGLEPLAQMNIHGVAAGPRPRVYTADGGGFTVNTGSTLRYVEVHSTSGNPAVWLRGGATGDQLIVVGGGAGVSACAVLAGATPSVLRNSVCRGALPGSSGVVVGSNDFGVHLATITNVTAVGAGPGLDVIGSGNTTVTLNNTIAFGGGGADAQIDNYQAGQAATVSGSHNNFDSASVGGPGAAGGHFNDTARQTAPPVFADQANGDFHQAAASPTRDAGSSSAPDLGTVDFEGTPRTFGSAPDIGADEFALPGAAPGAARDLTTASATLVGSVNPEGKATSYHFDWGTTAAYGNSTAPAPAGRGVGAGEVSAAIAGLTPGTTYHFRVVATNPSGTTESADGTLTTPGAFTPSPGPSIVPTPFAGVGLGSGSVKVTGKRIASVRVTCPAASTGSCTGKLTLTARLRASKKSKKLVSRTVGSARLAIQPGATAAVKVKLTGSSFAALRKAGKLRVSAAAAATDTIGPAKPTTRAITLLPPKRRH